MAKPNVTAVGQNYKWSVVGALGVMITTATGLGLAVVFSRALTAQTILGLFGMQMSISLIIVLLVLRHPHANDAAKRSRFSMDNPWIAVPFSTVSGLLTSLVIHFLFP
jgi:hypothetical protein